MANVFQSTLIDSIPVGGAQSLSGPGQKVHREIQDCQL